MRDAVERSSASYHAMASELEDKVIRPYPTLNWLFLWSLTAKRRSAPPTSLTCSAARPPRTQPSPTTPRPTTRPWCPTQPCSRHAERLVDGEAKDSEAALDSLVAGYEDALETLQVTPKERDNGRQADPQDGALPQGLRETQPHPACRLGGCAHRGACESIECGPSPDDEGVNVDETAMEVATQVLDEPAPRAAKRGKAGAAAKRAANTKPKPKPARRKT